MNLATLAALELEAGNRDAATPLQHARSSWHPATRRSPSMPASSRRPSASSKSQGTILQHSHRTRIHLWLPASSGLIPTASSPRATWSRPPVHNRIRSEAALILAYAGDPAGARAELTQQPSSPTRDVYMAAVDWLDGRVDGARSAMADMTAREPMDWFAAGWASRIFRLSGDPTTGRALRTVGQYGRWRHGVFRPSA